MLITECPNIDRSASKTTYTCRKSVCDNCTTGCARHKTSHRTTVHVYVCNHSTVESYCQLNYYKFLDPGELTAWLGGCLRNRTGVARLEVHRLNQYTILHTQSKRSTANSHLFGHIWFHPNCWHLSLCFLSCMIAMHYWLYQKVT